MIENEYALEAAAAATEVRRLILACRDVPGLVGSFVAAVDDPQNPLSNLFKNWMAKTLQQKRRAARDFLREFIEVALASRAASE